MAGLWGGSRVHAELPWPGENDAGAQRHTDHVRKQTTTHLLCYQHKPAPENGWEEEDEEEEEQ